MLYRHEDHLPLFIIETRGRQAPSQFDHQPLRRLTAGFFEGTLDICRLGSEAHKEFPATGTFPEMPDTGSRLIEGALCGPHQPRNELTRNQFQGSYGIPVGRERTIAGGTEMTDHRST